jgi:hypothetical protein
MFLESQPHDCINYPTLLQSEISRAYVAEMENELEKNPRTAAQAVKLLSDFACR